ncbi:MAG: bifunctional (p)ppGpp synthetase/guanosine-3',5'-bis(diphosphate) 3'-pyrophosphohydrolase [Lachnospiraceae bacterium]|nr:bifunctional (p)ppGpp synthetase/guanosine-3',5'-bis(diphosphate) 3'-pyrophosphohydrolase [Lachnospiraceae bacterium]
MTNQKLYDDAVVYATKKHEGQTRKDGTPYINHPLKVAELVKVAGYDLKYQIAAVLHDTLEDTDATEDEIRIFGEDVLHAVQLLTRPEGMEEGEYVARILEDRMASAVKNADKIHNMIDLRTCGNPIWAEEYTKKSRTYYFGKFSSALDMIISNAITKKGSLGLAGPHFYCTKEKMELHLDKRKRRYNETREWYFSNREHPNFKDPKMKYWQDDVSKLYFASMDLKSAWALLDAGWMPIEIQGYDDEYNQNMRAITREEIEEGIKRLQGEVWFHDYVDVAKL